MPETTTSCGSCGTPLQVRAPEGLCPRCLVGMGMALAGLEPGTGSCEQEPSDRTPQCRLKSFGDYEVLDEIARGGMGVVYKARQISLNRTVALKVLLFGEFSSDDFVRRFRAEAEAAASLHHPNIVAIHEIGQVEGRHYFSMDYVEGKNLAKIVRRKALATAKAASYVSKIARAIHYAHEQGILHRDLKPSNILISANDDPKVTDFGLAKRIHNSPELTRPGQVLGTPGYTAPEQAAGNSLRTGTASDVYSLGAILYFVLTGRPPFLAETLEDTIWQVLHAEPVRPQLLNSAVPRDLETICLKCLCKEPDARYGSAAALADDLDRWLAGRPILARAAGPVEKVWRWCGREPVVAGLLGAVLVLSLTTTIVSSLLFARERHAREREAQLRELAQAQAETRQKVISFLSDRLKELPQLVALTDRTAVAATLHESSQKVSRQFGREPEVEYEVRMALANAYHEVSFFEPMEEMAREAVSVARKGTNQLALANALALLGDPLMHLARYAEAEAAGAEALVLEMKSGNHEQALVRPLNLLGVSLQRDGLSENAEPMFAWAAYIISRNPGANVDAQLSQMADYLENIALGWFEEKRYSEAEQLQAQVWLIRRQVSIQDEDAIATAQHNLARIVQNEGNLDLAETLYCEALQSRQRLHGPNHASVATTLRNFGQTLRQQRKLAEAKEMYQRALAIRLRHFEEGHPRVVESKNDLIDLGQEETQAQELEAKARAALP